MWFQEQFRTWNAGEGLFGLVFASFSPHVRENPSLPEPEKIAMMWVDFLIKPWGNGQGPRVCESLLSETAASGSEAERNRLNFELPY
jgi:hypothetical protein